MKTKGLTRNMSRRLKAPPLPDGCVIRIHGQNIEVPAIFKSWIFDEPQMETLQDPVDDLG